MSLVEKPGDVKQVLFLRNLYSVRTDCWEHLDWMNRNV